MDRVILILIFFSLVMFSVFFCDLVVITKQRQEINDQYKTECESLGGEHIFIRQHLNQPLVICLDKKAILFKKGVYNES